MKWPWSRPQTFLIGLMNMVRVVVPKVRARYRRDKPVEEIRELIKKAVLEISKDPNVTEIDSKDLAEKLKETMLGAKFGGTSAGAIAGKAVNDLLTFLKGQPTSSKKTVVNTVVNAVKTIEQKPEQAVQIATQAANITAPAVAQAQPAAAPEPEKREEVPKDLSGAINEPIKIKEETSILEKELTLTKELYFAFTQKVDEINARFKKLKIQPIRLHWISEGQDRVRDFDTKLNRNAGDLKTLVKFKIVVPKLTINSEMGDYKFIASINHKSNVGNLMSTVPGTGRDRELVDLFSNAPANYCDHCKTTRDRSNTFVIADPSGKLLRVGGNCLKFYLPGGASKIDKLTEYFQMLSDVSMGYRDFETKMAREDEDGDGEYRGSGRSDLVFVRDALGLALAFSVYGYKSAKYAGTEQSTGSLVQDALNGTLEDKALKYKNDQKLQDEVRMLQDFRENKEVYYKQVQDIIDWGLDYLPKAIEDPANSHMLSYFTDLLKMVQAGDSGYIPERFVTMLVSIIPGYKKAKGIANKQREGNQEKKISQYIGTPGLPIGQINLKDVPQNIRAAVRKLDLGKYPYNGAIEATISNVKVSTSEDFGSTARFEAVDSQGNVLKWSSKGFYSPEELRELNSNPEIIIPSAKVVSHTRDFMIKVSNIKLDNGRTLYNNSERPLMIYPNTLHGQMPSPDDKQQAINVLQQSLKQIGNTRIVDCDIQWIIKPRDVTYIKGVGRENAVDFRFKNTPASPTPSNESVSFADYYSLKAS